MSDTSQNKVFSVEQQCDVMTFSAVPSNPTTFYVKSRTGPFGNTPTVITGFCGLPINGRKVDNVRGVNVFNGKHNQKFMKIKMALKESCAKDVFELCRKTLEAWKKTWDPIKHSMWYQKRFDLEDGTKTHKATRCITDLSEFRTLSFDGDELYESPCSSFGVIYADGDDLPWYMSITVPQPKESDTQASNPPSLYLYDEQNRRFKSRSCDGVNVYPAGGIPLSDDRAIMNLVRSSMYQDLRWNARVGLQMTSIEWRIGTCASTGDRVLYPKFGFRTVGSIVMKRVETTLPDGMVPVEKRESLLDTFLFEGCEMPVRKRKRASKPKKSAGEPNSPPDSSTVVYETDIEGE